MFRYLLKWFLFTSALIFVGCGSDGDESAPAQDSMSGTVSSLMDFIIPSAHAASEECSSSKSEGSVLFAELYKITSTEKLATAKESEGLVLLCDVDIISGKFDFKVNKQLLGDTPLKVKIVDNTPEAIHRGKEIITNVLSEDHNVDKTKTVQARLIAERLKKDAVAIEDLDEETLDKMAKRFRKDVVEQVLSANNQSNRDVEDLIGMIEVLEGCFDRLYQGQPDDATADDLASVEDLPDSLIIMPPGDLANMPEDQRCFFNASTEAELEQCEQVVESQYAKVGEIFEGFLTSSGLQIPGAIVGGSLPDELPQPSQQEIDAALQGFDVYLESLDPAAYPLNIRRMARREFRLFFL